MTLESLYGKDILAKSSIILSDDQVLYSNGFFSKSSFEKFFVIFVNGNREQNDNTNIVISKVLEKVFEVAVDHLRCKLINNLNSCLNIKKEVIFL